MGQPTSYEQLLDVTIEYLEDLQARGVRYVTLTPEADPGLEPGAPSTSPEPAEAMELPTSAAPVVPPAAGPVLASAAPASPAPSVPLSPETKVQALAELRERALACTKCLHLAQSRKNVVFGVGNIQADLMFVGEAPGADEDAQGEPFVGRAGELLTKIIQTMGLQRQDVYIANILKCRPDTPGQSRGNRKPTADEMQTCIPYLHAQIDLIQPKVLVALGATAMEGLIGSNAGITRLRGHWHEYRGIPLMPTYHPAFLLRNQSNTEKRKVWEDMLEVMARLAMPISDTQRGYFLKKD